MNDRIREYLNDTVDVLENTVCDVCKKQAKIIDIVRGEVQYKTCCQSLQDKLNKKLPKRPLIR